MMKLTDLTVARTIAAPAEEVFDVWIDPKSPGGPWFGAQHVILNAAVDGLFYLGVQHEGRSWHTWVSEATKGVESVVAVSFEARGDETEVTLRHTGVPDVGAFDACGAVRCTNCAG